MLLQKLIGQVERHQIPNKTKNNHVPSPRLNPLIGDEWRNQPKTSKGTKPTPIGPKPKHLMEQAQTPRNKNPNPNRAATTTVGRRLQQQQPPQKHAETTTTFRQETKHDEQQH